jgi:uncharacterized iron-regulated protein
MKKLNIKHHLNISLGLILILHYSYTEAQITEQHYKIYDSKKAKEISIDELIEGTKNVEVLFFGEEHNDSVAHYLEKSILEKFAITHKNGLALSLEMFDRDVQTIMNEYLTGAIREKNFLKDARVWSNYRDYKPMIEYAKENKIDVICANAAGRYSNLAGRKGQQALMELPKASQLNFAPLPYDTASGKYYEKLMALTSHEAPITSDTTKKQAPKMSMGNFNLIMAQSLWDATMAYAIATYLSENKSKKVFQVNGRFHSDEGYAIVTQLMHYRPKTTLAIISASSDESFPMIDWSKHSTLGDYIIITDPKIPKTFKD